MSNKIQKSDVFKKAAKMRGDSWVNVEHEDDVTSIVSVVDPNSSKEHLVSIKYDEVAKVIKATCSCTIQSLKSKHLPLCSHIVSAVNELTSMHVNSLQLEVGLNDEEVELINKDEEVLVRVDTDESEIFINLFKHDKFGSAR